MVILLSKNKKRLKKPVLETSKLTRGTTQIAAFRRHFTL
jgi:hypothetical protein